jgi:hypothetical protein
VGLPSTGLLNLKEQKSSTTGSRNKKGNEENKQNYTKTSSR